MSEKNVPGITKITVKGFKSIAEECAIEIRPLTVLAGANGSGKSSIMQPLLLLKQTLEATKDPGPLLLDGPVLKFTSIDQVLSTLSKKEEKERFSVGVETLRGTHAIMVTTVFEKRGDGVDIVERRGGSGFKLHPSILNTVYVPAVRDPRKRFYEPTDSVETFEYATARILQAWETGEDKRLKRVTEALVNLGLPGHIWTADVGDLGIEVRVGRSPEKADMVNIADAGFGVSQVLPVLVALIAAEPGALVYLEQPELHLHPRAQVALAEVLADAVRRDVRLVVETHSALLLLRIQTLVADRNLSPELVKLHWFSRNGDGVTEVESGDLDEAGAYGSWPEDFDDVSLKAQSEYIKAAQSHFREGI